MPSKSNVLFLIRFALIRLSATTRQTFQADQHTDAHDTKWSAHKLHRLIPKYIRVCISKLATTSAPFRQVYVSKQQGNLLEAHQDPSTNKLVPCTNGYTEAAGHRVEFL